MSTEYTLSCGTHATPEEGRCAMEWVSHLAGEPHSDEPARVSPVLRAFCTSLNDGLEDIPRQRLRLYLPRMIGTSGDGLDDRRGWMAMDWLIRVHTPTWLSAAGLTSASERLRSLGVVSGVDDLTAALVELRFAHQLARGARGTRLGLWLAPAVAARERAWVTAAPAAWAAARAGAGDIAGDRARAATRAAAGTAAATIARGARAFQPSRRARRSQGGSRPDARRAAGVRVRATGSNAPDSGAVPAARRARPAAVCAHRVACVELWCHSGAQLRSSDAGPALPG
jgi:hypothetical protein